MTDKKWWALAIIPVVVVVDILILLPFIIQPSMEEMVPPTLAAFFDTFDRNHDNEINIVEAEAFYNWCKANIPYRYDDEQQVNPAPGVPVGDGRPGAEYWQKPIETYYERMGDCEDMAIFSVAFYRHYNISAYMVSVNAEGEGADHAACVVNIGTSNHEVQEVADYLGGIVYYERDDGFYMLVDVAYANRLGQAGSNPSETSQLLEENRFQIQDWITLEQAYKMSG
jgi:hypothetical protein